MEKLSKKVLYALLATSGSLIGFVSLLRCSGSCTSCLGCAGAGAGAFAVALFNLIKGGEKKNGMA